MLSCTRSSASRVASKAALRRRFATATDVAGIRVAAIDNGQPSTSVTILVKAGTRYEPKAGAAGLLKNYAFKSTTEKSSLRIARESEFFGGSLSASLGREHLALTAEFLKGDESYFVPLLAEVLTKPKFAPHELPEAARPALEAEHAEFASNPAASAIDAAHALAFRNGLGSPLVAAPHAAGHVSVADIKGFASSAFAKDNVAVFGTGISQEALTKLVQQSLADLPASAKASEAKPTQYFGGESRISLGGHEHGPFTSPQTIFIGFGTTSPSVFELHTLKALLSPRPQLKWSKSSTTSPLFEKLPAKATVEPVLLSYSDASLFGLLIQAPTTAEVHEAGKVAVVALKTATQGGNLKAEEVKKAINKAKFDVASSTESRQGLLEAVSPHLLGQGPTTIETTFAALDKVDAASVAKVASTLIKSKPVYVAVGDIQKLPYADELGL